MRIHFDATSNSIKIPEIKKQIEDNIRKKVEESMPEIIKRIGEIPSFITHEVGFIPIYLTKLKIVMCKAYFMPPYL